MEHFKKAKSFDFMRVNMKVPKILFKKVSLTCTTQSKYKLTIHKMKETRSSLLSHCVWPFGAREASQWLGFAAADDWVEPTDSELASLMQIMCLLAKINLPIDPLVKLEYLKPWV